MARKNRTKLLTLDEETWELALKKSNFSEWVRNQLRSERNKSATTKVIAQLEKEIEFLEKKTDFWYRKLMESTRMGEEE